MERDPNDSKVMIHLEYIRGSVDAINGRLDTLNGKTQKHAQDIAVLYDRATEAKRYGGIWGGVLGAVIGGLASWWQYLTDK